MSIIIKKHLQKQSTQQNSESWLIKLIKEHNHEIWRSCVCGNEEDIRMNFNCSECGLVIFTPSKNYERQR